MDSDLARTTYREIEVNGANSVQLVVMLYSGAIRFLREAKSCAENKDLRGRTAALNRALAILGELQSTLKMEEGGEIAQSLDRLYTYITGRLLDFSAKDDYSGIDESVRILLTLNSAWTELAGKGEHPKTQPAATPSAATESKGLEFFG